jgi:hypothetical protein
MEHSIVVNGLVTRASEIQGQIAILEGQLAQRRADLTHLRATIQMFDPSYEGKPIRPKLPAVPRSSYFANGEITRRCREAIRDSSGPVSADDVAVKAMTDKSLDLADKKIRSDMIRRFLWAFQRLGVEGEARKIGNGLGARWTLPEQSQSIHRV